MKNFRKEMIKRLKLASSIMFLENSKNVSVSSNLRLFHYLSSKNIGLKSKNIFVSNKLQILIFYAPPKVFTFFCICINLLLKGSMACLMLLINIIATLVLSMTLGKPHVQLKSFQIKNVQHILFALSCLKKMKSGLLLIKELKRPIKI